MKLIILLFIAFPIVLKGQNYELLNKYYCSYKKGGKIFVNTGINCELELHKNNKYEYKITKGCLLPEKTETFKGQYEISGKKIILYKKGKKQILMKLKIKEKYLQEKKFLGFFKKKKIFRPIEDY